MKNCSTLAGFLFLLIINTIFSPVFSQNGENPVGFINSVKTINCMEFENQVNNNGITISHLESVFGNESYYFLNEGNNREEVLAHGSLILDSLLTIDEPFYDKVLQVFTSLVDAGRNSQNQKNIKFVSELFPAELESLNENDLACESGSVQAYYMAKISKHEILLSREIYNKIASNQERAVGLLELAITKIILEMDDFNDVSKRSYEITSKLLAENLHANDENLPIDPSNNQEGKLNKSNTNGLLQRLNYQFQLDSMNIGFPIEKLNQLGGVCYAYYGERIGKKSSNNNQFNFTELKLISDNNIKYIESGYKKKLNGELAGKLYFELTENQPYDIVINPLLGDYEDPKASKAIHTGFASKLSPDKKKLIHTSLIKDNRNPLGVVAYYTEDKQGNLIISQRREWQKSSVALSIVDEIIGAAFNYEVNNGSDITPSLSQSSEVKSCFQQKIEAACFEKINAKNYVTKKYRNTLQREVKEKSFKDISIEKLVSYGSKVHFIEALMKLEIDCLDEIRKHAKKKQIRKLSYLENLFTQLKREQSSLNISDTLEVNPFFNVGRVIFCPLEKKL